MNSINLIKKLSNASGAPGFEDDVCEVIKNNCEGLTYRKDSMLNVYLTASNFNENKPTVMLDAHLDEVGFMVQSIDAKGLINFITLGGWVTTNIPSQIVKIKNKEGEYIKGVVTSKPSHFITQRDRDRKLEIEDLKIDVGATSREEVINDFKIDIAMPIVPCVEFEHNEKNGIMRGKAFDNRLGCGVLIKVMQGLIGKELNVNVVGALATQEEAGLRGAQVTSYNVNPDIAIVFEGTPADDLYTDEFTCQSGLKKGPQLRHRDNSFISNPRFINYAKKVAEDNNIIYQEAVRRAGGTDAGKIHLSRKGIPTIVIGVPTRYIHSHYCYASIDDFNATVEWTSCIIKAIDREAINNF